MLEMNRQQKERWIALERERAARDALDGIKQFRPYPKQKMFIDSVTSSTTLFNLFFAANRGGKTRSGAFCGAYFARFGTPERPNMPTIGCVVSISEKTTIRGVQPYYLDNKVKPIDPKQPPFIPPWLYDENHGGKWDPHRQFLRLTNGSVIWFVNTTQDVDTIQGTEFDWIQYDEIPSKPWYDETSMRFGSRPLRKWMTATVLPDESVTGGINWVFDAFQISGNRTLLPHAKLFTASIYDNPFNTPQTIAEMEAEFPPGDPRRQIRLEGQLLRGVGGARAYANFNSDIHVRTLDELSPHIPLCLAMDINVVPMTCLIGQRMGQRFYVHDEIKVDGSILNVAEKFREKVPTFPNEIWLYGDSWGIRRNAQTGRTTFDLFIEEIQPYYPRIRLKVRGNNPGIIGRISAVNKALRTAEGTTNILVSPNATELIKDLDQVLLDHNGEIKKSYQSNDPYSQRTHLSDCLGYWVEYEAPVRTESGLTTDITTIPSFQHNFNQRRFGTQRYR